MFLVPMEFWIRVSEETRLLSCFSFTRSLRVKKKCKLSLGKKIETNLRKGHCYFAVNRCRFRCLVFGLPIITDSFHRTPNSFNISRNWVYKSSVQVYDLRQVADPLIGFKSKKLDSKQQTAFNKTLQATCRIWKLDLQITDAWLVIKVMAMKWTLHKYML